MRMRWEERSNENAMQQQLTATTISRGEIWLTRVMILTTVLASFLFFTDAARHVMRAWADGHSWSVARYIGISLACTFPIYGNLVYQFARMGYLKRLLGHHPAATPELEEFTYTGEAPSLTILVPSYKEEQRIIAQTVLSAAFQEYPRRRVVLLIDDPYASADPADQRHLAATRQLIRDLHAQLAEPAELLAAMRADYLARRDKGRVVRDREALLLAEGYEYAAEWFAAYAASSTNEDHTDRFFLERIINPACVAHHERATQFRALAAQGQNLTERRIAREYARLAGLFAVEITSFERKKYVNLSHEANKAMNLNSYIALIGRRWRERQGARGLMLIPAGGMSADLAVPPTDYVITLDADSLILPGYALRLVHFMEQPEHARMGVVQTPYSAIPQAPNAIERIAGATTDIQFLVHQGFTYFNSTFWVGANALIRKAALDDIRVIEREDGKQVTRYIQDRTVIEDTESTIDLVDKGWRLHNYPERLAYSATPPDFGALLIQRRRWANGGLIIFPKLLRYILRSRHPGRLAEGLVRSHYLTSLGGVSVGMLLLLALPPQLTLISAWLPLTTIPYHLLYCRDLKRFGYQRRDMIRIYGLNLLLIPINLGGVLKSLQQSLTGAKIPFGRTPKVLNRTATPALYIFAEYALGGSLLYGVVIDVRLGQWGLAAFALANFLVLIYSITVFIGLRTSLEDLTPAVRTRLAQLPKLPAFAPAEAPVPTLVLRQGATEEHIFAMEHRAVYNTVDLRRSS